jgi:hypothetical protein
MMVFMMFKDLFPVRLTEKYDILHTQGLIQLHWRTLTMLLVSYPEAVVLLPEKEHMLSSCYRHVIGFYSPPQ